MFEADDLDAAIELACAHPAARLGGAIEVRSAGGALAILEQAFRDQWGRVLATLIGSSATRARRGSHAGSLRHRR